jgi:hypothetical protein
MHEPPSSSGNTDDFRQEIDSDYFNNRVRLWNGNGPGREGEEKPLPVPTTPVSKPATGSAKCYSFRYTKLVTAKLPDRS